MIIDKLLKKSPAAAAPGALPGHPACADDRSCGSVADRPDPSGTMQAVIVHLLSRTRTNWGLA